MAVQLITFKTNHTILADVTVDSIAGVYKAKQPVQVVSVPPRSADDPGSIAFSPFIEYSKEFQSGIEFKISDTLCITSPVLELENQYNSIFGSGITIAPASILKR